jgi:hypothetical protein
LIKYLFQGKLSTDGPFGKKGERKSENYCMEVIQYADKYGLGSYGCDIVYDELEEKWRPNGEFIVDANDRWISRESIEIIFQTAPAGHRLRSLATSAACWRSLGSLNPLYLSRIRKTDSHEYADLEKTVDGFAAETVLLLRSEINNQVHFVWSKDMRYN